MEEQTIKKFIETLSPETQTALYLHKKVEESRIDEAHYMTELMKAMDFIPKDEEGHYRQITQIMTNSLNIHGIR
jgi:hypothetical protein